MSRPRWRSDVVVALCRSMRESGDYSALPVLADALQEADYPDGEVLRTLRSGLGRTESERWVALLYSDATNRAVDRLDRFAAALGEGGYPSYDAGWMTYERLVEAARSYAETGDDGLGDGCMNWSNEMMGREERDFWRDWSLVTGRPAPDEYDRRTFLDCHC